ncbi:MAG: hypothetical protein WAqPseu_00660 [Shewanella algae]
MWDTKMQTIMWKRGLTQHFQIRVLAQQLIRYMKVTDEDFSLTYGHSPQGFTDSSERYQ